MSQLPSVTGLTPRAKPGMDIYGVMLILASIFVLAATIFIFYKTQVMLGNVLPTPGD